MSMPDAQGPGAIHRLGREMLRAWSEGDEDRALVPLDPEGRILDWDAGAERLEGWTAGEVVGRDAATLWEAGEGGPPGGFAAALAEARERGRADRDVWRRRADGSRYRARVALIALSEPDGTPIGFAHLTRDSGGPTELAERARRAEAELAEIDGRKEEFLAMLAHELRNPLSPMLNASQILRLRGDCPETAARMRAMIEQQVRHMSRLIDDLLDASRITRGKIRLRIEPLELADVAARAVESARPLMEASGHALTVALPARPLRVQGDTTRLEQVIANLLNNAAKYTDAGGSVRLEVGRDGQEAVICVRDSGIGIAPPMLPRVFDLFAQADCSLDRSRGGLGIGLTLVRSLALLHGGSVQARSAGLGQGSEFIVRLPALPELPAADPAAAPGPFAAEGSGRPVLIVDDNVSAASSLAMLVDLWGHPCLVAHDGPHALELASNHRPGIVLLDIGLPLMDGYEVARRLRVTPGVERSLVVAMTGYGQEEDRRRSREAGFDHHLVKPVDLDALERLLARPGSESSGPSPCP